MKSVNFKAIPGWENLNEEVLLCKGGTFEVAEAKLKELQNWRINKVYDEVDDEKQSSISVRWVLTEKLIEGKTQVKARLVARGFEDAGRDDVRKDSPTCGRENLRLLFALTSSCNWRINILDIKSAFLQGKSIERDVFIKPPKEANTNKLWKLNTTVYGLCDAPREWYLSVKKELLATGCVKSRYDDAIFYWHKENTSQGILSAHVDDFCWAGTKLFQNIVINHIRNAFTVSKEELQTFKYLGLSISQTNDGIFMHQKEYIEEIEVVDIDKPNQKDRKLLPHETQQLRRVAGQLNWVSTQTRPDMTYAASVVSSSIKDATVRDLVKEN